MTNLAPSREHSLTNQTRSVFVRHDIRVDNEVIQQRIINIHAEVFLKIPLPAEVLTLHKLARLFRAPAIKRLHVFDSFRERADQADVENVIQVPGYQAAASP